LSPNLSRTGLAVPATHSPSTTWIIVVFIAVAAGFLLATPAPSPATPLAAEPPVPKATVRTPSLVPKLHKDPFVYNCNSCHQNIEPRPFIPGERQRKLLAEHTTVVLEHGRNKHCLNCHHREEREAFTDHAGGQIPYDQPEELCAKCHGIKYRDWLRGSHGRRNGYWDQTRGKQTRSTCIACHDPHSPSFAPIAPMAPPHNPTPHTAHTETH
jgi:hypothetical protein